MLNSIVDVLMDRDGMSREEAEELKERVREEVADAAAAGDYDLVEDIMYSELGLEMDYIHELIC